MWAEGVWAEGVWAEGFWAADLEIELDRKAKEEFGESITMLELAEKVMEVWRAEFENDDD